MRRRRFLQGLLGAGAGLVGLEQIRAQNDLAKAELTPEEAERLLARRMPHGGLRSDVPDVLNDHADRLDTMLRWIHEEGR